VSGQIYTLVALPLEEGALVTIKL